MIVIKCHSYYWQCNSKNCWRSVDANFQDGVGSISLSLFPVKAANNFVMTVCNLSPPRLPKIQDQQLLTLHWCSVQDVIGHMSLFVLIFKMANKWKSNIAIPLSLFCDWQWHIWMRRQLVKPERQNKRLELTGLAIRGRIRWLTDACPGLARQ